MDYGSYSQSSDPESLTQQLSNKHGYGHTCSEWECPWYVFDSFDIQLAPLLLGWVRNPQLECSTLKGTVSIVALYPIINQCFEHCITFSGQWKGQEKLVFDKPDSFESKNEAVKMLRRKMSYQVLPCRAWQHSFWMYYNRWSYGGIYDPFKQSVNSYPIKVEV